MVHCQNMGGEISVAKLCDLSTPPPNASETPSPSATEGGAPNPMPEGGMVEQGPGRGQDLLLRAGRRPPLPGGPRAGRARHQRLAGVWLSGFAALTPHPAFA